MTYRIHHLSVVQRGNAIPIALLAVIVALVALTAGASWFALAQKSVAEQARSEAIRARRAESQSEVEKRRAERDSDRARSEASALRAERDETLGNHMTALAHSLDSLRARPDWRVAQQAWRLRTNSLSGLWVSPNMARHDRPVTSVVFSADGTRIASGSKDHSVRVWDAAPAQASSRNAAWSASSR